jgi:potassium uptake TrkH family protein
MKLNKDILAERLNNLLYNSRPQALRISRILTSLAAVVGLGLMVYLFGFNLLADDSRIYFSLMDILLGVFLLSFLIRWLYAFRRIDFLRNALLESTLMALVLFRAVDHFLLDGHLLTAAYGLFEERGLSVFYRSFISLLFILLLILEFSRLGANLSSVKIKPNLAFLLSFILLILGGTVLLMLPAMTTQTGSMSFLDAFFTAVSASCVTGLIVVDTATFFTTRGQLVILLLIQIGGLGILSFATFFASYLSTGIGYRQKMMVPDYLDNETLASSGKLLRQIVFITLFIEFGTFVLLFFSWNVPFDSLEQKLFFSAFHAVSAFCNAGFSLFSNGLYEEVVRSNYILHLIIAASLILGALGFAPIKDVCSPKRLRDRLEHPWKDWNLSTRIAVNVSVVLLIVGTVLFFLLEKDNTLADKNLSESLLTSFFQSATTRTAGFNTVDFAQLTSPTLVLMMILMFIGGASGSTAGGIKTSTFYLILMSVIAISRGYSRIHVGKRYIPTDILFKALSIFFYGVAINALVVFLLSITEKDTDMMALIFEQVSAFGTVGLSTGITGTLSSAGKVLIIISMFLGRVGTLTFAVAMSTRIDTENYKLPAANVMVG